MRPWFLLLTLVAEGAGAASAPFEQTAIATVRETILGGVALLAIGVALWAILRLQRTQDAWLRDKDAHASRAEASNEKDRERSEKHTEAIRDLAQAVRENTRAIETIRASTDATAHAIDRQGEVVKFALQKHGRKE